MACGVGRIRQSICSWLVDECLPTTGSTVAAISPRGKADQKKPQRYSLASRSSLLHGVELIIPGILYESSWYRALHSTNVLLHAMNNGVRRHLVCPPPPSFRFKVIMLRNYRFTVWVGMIDWIFGC